MTEKPTDGNYAPSWQRWVNVACLFGACLAQSSLMMQFSPVASLVRDAYETDDLLVSSNATIFLIVLAILDLPSVYLLDSGKTQGQGLIKWLKIACALTIFGQWSRYLVLQQFPNQFWMAIIPSGVIALGNPFLINSISKLACIWFSDKERALAIGIVSFSYALGSIVGLTFGTFFVHEEHKDNNEMIRDETTTFMWWVAWATTFLCTPLLLFYKQRPSTFPSKSAEEDANKQKTKENSISNQLLQLSKNRNFILIFIFFSIMNGSYVCFGVIIDFLLRPFGFTPVDTSIMGSCFILSGLVSSIIFPILIEKRHWFLRSLRIIAIGTFISSLILMISLPQRSFSFTFCMIAIGSMGFFVIPTMSIVYALATEFTYPISEALFGCLLQAGSSIFGTILSYVGSYVINNFGAFYLLIIFTMLYMVCCGLAVFVREDLRRLRLDEKSQDLMLSNDFTLQL